MSKHEPSAPSGAQRRPSDSGSRARERLEFDRRPLAGRGRNRFCRSWAHGSGPMAANLAASGRRVIAYVRRRDQLEDLKRSVSGRQRISPT